MHTLAATQYRAVFASVPGLHLVLDLDLIIIDASDAYLTATMTSREEIAGRHIFDAFPDNPDDPNATGVHNLSVSLRKVLQTGRPDKMAVQKYDIRRPLADGGGFEVRYWQPYNSAVLDAGGHAELIIHSVEDVTELIVSKQREAEQERVADELRQQGQQMRAEIKFRTEQLRETENRFRELVEGSKDHSICMLDAGGNVVSWNSGAERIKGFQADEIIGQHLSRFYPPEQIETGRPHFALEVASTQDRFEEEALRVRKDGSQFWADVVITALRDPEGRLRGYSKITRDITDRKRAEEVSRKLREEEAAKRAAQSRAEAIWEQREQFRVTLRSIGDGVIVTDETGNVQSLNTVAEELTGWNDEEARGRPLTEVFKIICEETRNPIDNPAQRALSEGAIIGLANHTILISQDGTERAIADSAAPIRSELGKITGVVLVFRDVSDAKRQDEQNRQSQRMESIGNLAGGIAHDFNNLLTVINGYSQYLIDDAALSANNRTLATEILKAGSRAASLTRQLLAFSRKQVMQPVVLDLNDVVGDTAKMLERLIGEDISLSTVLSAGLWPVKVDRGQIEQVLLNFAVNARDAMPDGGKLTLQTANTELDSNCTRWLPDLRPGSYVLLAVTDTGCGMSPHVRARIFEPFFTTKAPGKGTGLGLSTVFGIVKQSGGQISVSSQEGVGTCFKVYLPRAEDPPKRQVERKSQPPMARGTETVLVVEDEDLVRSLTVRILEHLGYTVIEAANGRQALDAWKAHHGKIELVLTDVVMPELGGRQLVEALRQDHPGLKTLFMSGYTDDAVVTRGILQLETEYIQKPFTPAKLAEKLREILDR